jgi:hypothetical protein
MSRIFSSVTSLIGKVSKKYYALSFPLKVILFYILVAIPFLYYHESHLPLGIIILLTSFTITVAVLLALVSFYMLGWVFRNEEIIFPEVLLIVSSLLIIYFLGLLENNAGIIFSFFSFVLFIFFRIFKIKVLHRVILLGLLIMINGLLSFQALQKMELFLFQHSFQDKYDTSALDLTKWEDSKDKKIYKNSDIPMEFELPEGFFFHNPKDLNVKNQTGSGQIAGIISNNIREPNQYPYIRFFIISGYNKVDFDTIQNEYSQLLDFDVHRNEIETVKLLGPHKIDSKKWEGRFWAFFDIMRPRTAKAGFYLIPLANNHYLVIDIRENYSETSFHEKDIEFILEHTKL